jgi:hypothetical protein
VEVPGALELTVLAGETAGEGSGVLLLSRNGVARRVPFWFAVSAPVLGEAPVRRLRRPGVHQGDTRGRQALVTTYRYPQVPPGGAVTARLAGPEQVFRVRIARPVANFGVAITSRARGVDVEPRVVRAGDEGRLTGYPGLPVNLNPYLRTFLEPSPVAGALRPARGDYDVVFDGRSASRAGRFAFRFWIDDVTPPRARLLERSVRRGRLLHIRVSDAGAGVDPSSVVVRVDGLERTVTASASAIIVPTAALTRGRHRLRVQVSDHQETRNMENVGRILPNTRVLRAVVTVR